MKQVKSGFSRTNLVVGSTLALALMSGLSYARVAADATVEASRLAGAESARASTAPGWSDLEKLGPNSDVSKFMDRGVDEHLRRAALKKIFHMPGVASKDDLSVYARDYTKLERMTPVMVAELLPSAMTGSGASENAARIQVAVW